MHRPGVVLAVSVCGVAIFFATAFLAIPRFGALGANMAHIALASLTAIVMDVVWLRLSRSTPETDGAAAAAVVGR
jgi:O-antigen/teichoic acid export membrane protein